MSFSERELKFTFSGAPSGILSAAGLRSAASIQVTDGLIGVTAQVKIWGLTLAQMNQYSDVIPSAIGDTLPDANLVIEAGDLGSPLVQIISGPIWSSYIDLTGAPESLFVVSVAGINDLATPLTSQSRPPLQPGQPSVSNAEDLIANICAGAGLTFNKNGAHGVLTNMSTSGSALKQIDTIARAAGFRWMRNGSTISIWPKGGTIDDVGITVGPNTDPQMVGYPTYWENGIIVTSLFNPQVLVGRRMNVTGSSIQKANGPWQIVYVQHDLTTMISKGPWFTTATLAGIDA
jgi:hypothetical protein